MARPRRSEGTRQALLDTGATMLRERGYHGTGLKEVLDRVGVPKGSFYNYFESKEEFGAAVIRHMAECVWEQLDALEARAQKDALVALRRHYRQAIQDVDRERCSGGCLFGNLSGEVEDSEACREALAEAFDGIGRRMAKVIELGQAQGTLRDDVRARDLADQLIDAWEGALLRMKVERSVRPLRQCVRRLLEGDFLT